MCRSLLRRLPLRRIRPRCSSMYCVALNRLPRMVLRLCRVLIIIVYLFCLILRLLLLPLLRLFLRRVILLIRVILRCLLRYRLRVRRVRVRLMCLS